MRAISASLSAFFLANSLDPDVWLLSILGALAVSDCALGGGALGVVAGGGEDGTKFGGGPGGAIFGAIASFPCAPSSPCAPFSFGLFFVRGRI